MVGLERKEENAKAWISENSKKLAGSRRVWNGTGKYGWRAFYTSPRGEAGQGMCTTKD